MPMTSVEYRDTTLLNKSGAGVVVGSAYNLKVTQEKTILVNHPSNETRELPDGLISGAGVILLPHTFAVSPVMMGGFDLGEYLPQASGPAFAAEIQALHTGGYLVFFKSSGEWKFLEHGQ